MNKPIESLQENASAFFEKVTNKYSDKMACKSGCSKCCFTDISVFDVEADLIRDWHQQLSIDDKIKLNQDWEVKSEIGACTFLFEDKCTIYNVRPIICRTQGAPLHLSKENILDYCPLNFLEAEPEKEYWLNLERLNTLLGFAAKTAERDSRIRLKKLKIELLKK